MKNRPVHNAVEISEMWASEKETLIFSDQMTAPAYDIFLSYSRKDYTRAQEFYLALESKGWLTFFDQQEIRPGDQFPMTIQRAASALIWLLFCCHGNQFAVHGSTEKQRLAPITAPCFPCSLNALVTRQLGHFLRAFKCIIASI